MLWFWALLQNGLATKVEKSRKQIKERKNRAKKIRGVKKVRNYCVEFGVFAFSPCNPMMADYVFLIQL